jgi:hypothetical protein
MVECEIHRVLFILSDLLILQIQRTIMLILINLKSIQFY